MKTFIRFFHFVVVLLIELIVVLLVAVRLVSGRVARGREVVGIVILMGNGSAASLVDHAVGAVQTIERGFEVIAGRTALGHERMGARDQL
jgi:hypothetical protein